MPFHRAGGRKPYPDRSKPICCHSTALTPFVKSNRNMFLWWGAASVHCLTCQRSSGTIYRPLQEALATDRAMAICTYRIRVIMTWEKWSNFHETTVNPETVQPTNTAFDRLFGYFIHSDLDVHRIFTREKIRWKLPWKDGKVFVYIKVVPPLSCTKAKVRHYGQQSNSL